MGPGSGPGGAALLSSQDQVSGLPQPLLEPSLRGDSVPCGVWGVVFNWGRLKVSQITSPGHSQSLHPLLRRA